jgi:anhydro-N-acetylmuramic acid kinase
MVVAVASGTSVDALDVAAVELAWTEPGVADVGVRGHRSVPWPADLRDRVLALLPPAQTTVAECCRLDNEIGRVIAEVAADAVDDLAGGRADLIVSPGQTVHHDVVGDRCHGTLQLGQPAWIAEATGLAVVSDLRATDVAAGGHGAPLVSLFDAAWLTSAARAAHEPARAALNLGGIANVTVVVRGGPVVAFDTGPANCLLDLAAQRVSDGRLIRDDDGRLAAAGRVRPDLLDRLLDHPYFRLDPPKSTGREAFSADLLDTTLAGLPPVGDADLLATLTALTARTVAAALEPYDVRDLVVSGGGVRNPALLAALRSTLPTGSIATSDEHGLPADAKEAVMWALLGFLTWYGVPGTAPGHKGAVTGAEATRPLGRISLGRSGARPPAPHPVPLDRLALRPIGAAA